MWRTEGEGGGCSHIVSKEFWVSMICAESLHKPLWQTGQAHHAASKTQDGNVRQRLPGPCTSTLNCTISRHCNANEECSGIGHTGTGDAMPLSPEHKNLASTRAGGRLQLAHLEASKGIGLLRLQHRCGSVFAFAELCNSVVPVKFLTKKSEDPWPRICACGKP